MSNILTRGRFFFALSLAAFGIQYFLYGQFLGGLPLVPPWIPGGPPAAYLAGVVLVAAGIGMAMKGRASLSATLLGSFFLLCAPAARVSSDRDSHKRSNSDQSL